MFTFPLDTHMCFSWKSLFLHDLYHVLSKKSNTLIPCPKLSSKIGSRPGNGLFETLSQPKLDQYQAWTFETQTSNLGCAWGRQIYFLGFHKFHISCFPVFPMFLFSCYKNHLCFPFPFSLPYSGLSFSSRLYGCTRSIIASTNPW